MDLSGLPEPVRSQIAAGMAQRDLETERHRADRMREDSNKLYELRGWLRLCDDDAAGHAEFYQWACHYIFGDEPAKEQTVNDRDVIRAILKQHLRETAYNHLRSVENNSTQALEDSLVGYCEGMREQLLAERLVIGTEGKR